MLSIMYDKFGNATCESCRVKLRKGEMRMDKTKRNGDHVWYRHVRCAVPCGSRLDAVPYGLTGLRAEDAPRRSAAVAACDSVLARVHGPVRAHGPARTRSVKPSGRLQS